MTVVTVHEIPAEAEPGHGEAWQDDEDKGETEVPVVVDPVLHGQVIKVVGHYAVHHKVEYVGHNGDEGTGEIKTVIPETRRQGVSLVPVWMNTICCVVNLSRNIRKLLAIR